MLFWLSLKVKKTKKKQFVVLLETQKSHIQNFDEQLYL